MSQESIKESNQEKDELIFFSVFRECNFNEFISGRKSWDVDLSLGGMFEIPIDGVLEFEYRDFDCSDELRKEDFGFLGIFECDFVNDGHLSYVSDDC